MEEKVLKNVTTRACLVLSDSLQPHGLYPTSLLLSMGFSRQEYWSGLPFPSPGDLPNQGIEPMSPVSPAFGRVFTCLATWEAQKELYMCKIESLFRAEICTTL